MAPPDRWVLRERVRDCGVDPSVGGGDALEGADSGTYRWTGDSLHLFGGVEEGPNAPAGWGHRRGDSVRIDFGRDVAYTFVRQR